MQPSDGSPLQIYPCSLLTPALPKILPGAAFFPKTGRKKDPEKEEILIPRVLFSAAAIWQKPYDMPSAKQHVLMNLIYHLLPHTPTVSF